MLKSGSIAVSLTYDDDLSSQLELAVPDLAAHNLRGTFFVRDVRDAPEPWRALRQKGHELGAHSLGHPCPHALGSWVLPGKGSEDYDLARMRADLDASVAMLGALGQPAPYSFAYPCGVTWVGSPDTSYVPLVRERFVAARGVTPTALPSGDVNLDVTPGAFMTGSGSQLVAKVKAAAAGDWVIFGFHGIDQQTLPVSRAAHAELLAHLDAHRDRIWTAPFGEVAACIRSSSNPSATASGGLDGGT